MIENSIAFTVHFAMLIVVKLRLTVFQNASFLAFKFCPEWRSERRLYLRPEIFTVNAIVFSTKHYYKTLFKPKNIDREHTLRVLVDQYKLSPVSDLWAVHLHLCIAFKFNASEKERAVFLVFCLVSQTPLTLRVETRANIPWYFARSHIRELEDA